jgi:hypothetical protein
MTKTNIVRLAARMASVGLCATTAGSGVRNVLANETVGKVDLRQPPKTLSRTLDPVR